MIEVEGTEDTEGAEATRISENDGRRGGGRRGPVWAASVFAVDRCWTRRATCLPLLVPSSSSHLPSFFTFCSPPPAMGANLSKAMGVYLPVVPYLVPRENPPPGRFCRA